MINATEIHPDIPAISEPQRSAWARAGWDPDDWETRAFHAAGFDPPEPSKITYPRRGHNTGLY